MPRNVFVSYKYADEDVQHLNGHYPTRARHYVDEVEKLLAKDDHIFFGEHDGEDLTDWEEDEETEAADSDEDESEEAGTENMANKFLNFQKK